MAKFPKKKLTIDCDGKKITMIDYGNWVTYENSEKQYHRIGGPAAIFEDGSENWYKNGKLHREDGPAIVRPKDKNMFGDNIYFINGVNMPIDEFKNRIANRRIKKWKT